jgi:ATP-binding cassette subfamily B protein
MPPRGARGFLTEEEKSNAPKVTWPLIRRVFSYLSPYKLQLAVALITIGLSSVLGMYPSIITGKIVDEGLIGRSLPMLVRLIVLSFMLNLLSNLIGVL